MQESQPPKSQDASLPSALHRRHSSHRSMSSGLVPFPSGSNGFPQSQNQPTFHPPTTSIFSLESGYDNQHQGPSSLAPSPHDHDQTPYSTRHYNDPVPRSSNDHPGERERQPTNESNTQTTMMSHHFNRQSVSNIDNPRRPPRSTASSFTGIGGISVFAAERKSAEQARMVEMLSGLERVIYRGTGVFEGEEDEDGGEVGRKELEAFLRENLETECVYESPLLTFQSRPFLLHALNLSHTLSETVLPSMTPSGMMVHAKWGVGKALEGLLGSTNIIESGKNDVKGKGKEKERVGSGNGDGEEEKQSWMSWAGGIPSRVFRRRQPQQNTFNQTSSTSFATGEVNTGIGLEDHDSQDDCERKGDDRAQKGKGKKEWKGWWSPWEVRSECEEIGSMECYDGYHLGFIDHTLHIDFLPSLVPPFPSSQHDHPMFPIGGLASGYTTPAPSTFALPNLASGSSSVRMRRSGSTSMSGYGAPGNGIGMARTHYNPQQQSGSSTATSNGIIRRTIAPLLHFQLHVHTLVELNEEGKICYIRDMVDLRDAWEGLIPFGIGRTVGWIGRRVLGGAVAGLGVMFGGGGTSSGTLEGETGYRVGSGAGERLRGVMSGNPGGRALDTARKSSEESNEYDGLVWMGDQRRAGNRFGEEQRSRTTTGEGTVVKEEEEERIESATGKHEVDGLRDDRGGSGSAPDMDTPEDVV